ncbi:UNVERIFIED_CONTAM: hypothetical protein GTU68_011293 [Idotea baltica]|nr:hypothetical protein [Idotea baltica]
MKIRSILLSVYHKDGLKEIATSLKDEDITVYSTGGTQAYLESFGVEVVAVESITGYPSILDGRVKTLHPKVFGGILAKRESGHLDQLSVYQIPVVDCVVVDLYPFEQTVRDTDEESVIIEKVDIGGIALIRAAAKNYKDVVIIPSADHYADLRRILQDQNGESTLNERQRLAAQAFQVSSHYDTAIFQYFNRTAELSVYKQSIGPGTALRYGENPDQQANYYGNLDDLLEQLNGKPLSYNNLIDVDAAVEIIQDFWEDKVTVAILKHTNPCGLATRATMIDAWKTSLAGDPVSSFGGIIITNGMIDLETAHEIDKLFYEVLIAPEFTPDAQAYLSRKTKRVLLKIKSTIPHRRHARTILNGVIEQERDQIVHDEASWTNFDGTQLSAELKAEMKFSNLCAKHLKSNAIAITHNRQLIGIGCGQTSRIDALNQAIVKAQHFGFELQDSVLASDAFFPFSDCVEIAHSHGIHQLIQPGGSIRDQDSIQFCADHNMTMVLTGHRHFKH